MLEQSEKHIRETLKQYKPEFHPSDWDAMELLLNKKEKKRILPFWLVGLPIAASLCLGMSLAFYLYSNHHTISENQFSLSNLKRNQYISKQSSFEQTSTSLNPLTAKNNIQSKQLNPSQTISKENSNQNKKASTTNETVSASYKFSSIENLPLVNGFNGKKYSEEDVLYKGLNKASNRNRVSLAIDHGFLFSANRNTETRTLTLNSLAISDFVVIPNVRINRILSVFAGIGYSNRPMSFPDSSSINEWLGTNENYRILFSSRRGLQMPIGVKLTCIEKNMFNLHVCASLINHIPLEEKYIYTEDNTLAESNLNFGSYSIQPATTSFAADNVSSSQTSNSNQPMYYKRGAKSKYFAEILISPSLEIKASKKVNVHFEPGYLVQIQQALKNELSAHQFNFKTGITINL